MNNPCNKDRYGTFITIEEAWGYDLEQISPLFRYGVLLDAGTKVRVKSVEHGSVMRNKIGSC